MTADNPIDVGSIVLVKSIRIGKFSVTCKLENDVEGILGRNDYTDNMVNSEEVEETFKKLYPKNIWDADKKIDFKNQIKNHVKSQRLETKEVGNDLEILFRGDVVAQVMFRNDYVGVKAKGEKFVDEFKYTELGKIKSAVSSIIKKCKN